MVCARLPDSIQLHSKFAVLSDRLCILVAGLLDAFVTANKLQRTNRGPGPLFRELVYGRIKMMTALCLAWAHTYQTMSLEFHREQLRPAAFELAKPKKFTVLPPCQITTRLADVESPGWKLVTDGGFTRNIDGNDMAGWVFAIVSPENLVRILLCAISAYRHSLVPRRAVTTQPELSGFAEAMRWANHFIPRGARLRILFYSKHATSVTIGTAHARRHISSAHTCNKLSVRLKCNFHVPAHHAHGHAGNTGNECADAAASLGMKGFVSENNVPVFRPECDIFVQRLFEVLHRLTQIAEVLHSMVVQSQPV